MDKSVYIPTLESVDKAEPTTSRAPLVAFLCLSSSSIFPREKSMAIQFHFYQIFLFFIFKLI